MEDKLVGMELCAVFETWHIGDGNYPPLKKGMLVNLSFEIAPDELARLRQPAAPRFKHLGDGEYTFSGEVLRVYPAGDCPLIVIDCGECRFYIESRRAQGFAPGDGVHGKGTLVLDHYSWVEYLHRYDDPPELFYTLRVEGIKKVKLPERFIGRSGGAISYPARVKPPDYAPNSVSEVDAIEDEQFCHYVVLFGDQNLPGAPVARTFK
jgi:hypothetical protein